ncbi:hypothetical protein E4U48_000698 [Claviceps purpurea]|nr:hypothetical protein E4U48_000698 [Claviceps purpurea]
MADDSSYEEEPAEGKSHKTSHNHCSHRNHHSHSDDDKVPHQRRSQRYEPEPAAERERRIAIPENQHRKKRLGKKMLARLSTVPQLRGPTPRLLSSPVIGRNLTLATDSLSHLSFEPSYSLPELLYLLSISCHEIDRWHDSRDRQEIEELRETVRRLEREMRHHEREDERREGGPRWGIVMGIIRTTIV